MNTLNKFAYIKSFPTVGLGYKKIEITGRKPKQTHKRRSILSRRCLKWDVMITSHGEGSVWLVRACVNSVTSLFTVIRSSVKWNWALQGFHPSLGQYRKSPNISPSAPQPEKKRT